MIVPTLLSTQLFSVPDRLGKGQGAKEIGHNLAHEKTKFGHNLVCKRHKIGLKFRARTTKSSTPLRVNDQNSVTIQHANEMRSGHNFVGDR